MVPIEVLEKLERSYRYKVTYSRHTVRKYFHSYNDKYLMLTGRYNSDDFDTVVALSAIIYIGHTNKLYGGDLYIAKGFA